jgi:AcrR family transcriptional regulator
MEMAERMPSSPKSPPRTKPALVRREELMNAAERLFLERGVATTTIDQITDAAGVAKGSFYLHFSSKEQIRAALAKRFAQQIRAKIDAAVAKQAEADHQGRLGAWAAAAALAYRDAIGLHDTLFFSAHLPTRESRRGAVDNPIVDSLVALLEEGQAAGAWSLEDIRVTAVFLFSGVHGVIDDRYAIESTSDERALSRRLERLCLQTIGARL